MKSTSLSLRLPAFFSPNMVIQRDMPARVFGWAPAGGRVMVSLAGHEEAAVAGTDGSWEVALPASPAGGRHALVVKFRRQIFRAEGILFGDVWFCSGQSNMAFALSRSTGADSTIRGADFPAIRHFAAERTAADMPATDVAGTWRICHPDSAGDFSAVAFYFAREVHRRTRVPIGLIHSSWGGTPVEAWLPGEAFHRVPALRPLLRVEKDLERSGRPIQTMFQRWKREHVSRDPGNKGFSLGWAGKSFDDSQWDFLRVPGFWEGQGLDIDGAVWFRRRIKIPKAWRGRDLALELGPIDDFDETYFNGVKIGATGAETENAHRVARVYRVPGELVATGTATLAVRIFDQFGSGGFVGQRDMLQLSCPERQGDQAVPLVGRWRFRVEWQVERPSPVPQPPTMPEPRAKLARLFNGMIHPFLRFPIKGFLWYQGESNVYRAAHYREAFPALIRAWRDCWSLADLPFYFVQLANFKTPSREPGDDCWAELREAQMQALDLPATGMAVAIDVGEAADVHPRNKLSVGMRLARLALARDYGASIASSGPVLESWSKRGREIILQFRETGSGLLTLDGKPIRGFAVAGSNFRWVWAAATIHGTNKVILSTQSLARPLAVRYGWATNPACNLANSHRLPASPFRTDNQPLSTERNLWPA